MTEQHDDSALNDGGREKRRDSEYAAGTQPSAFSRESEGIAAVLLERVGVHEVLGEIASSMLQPPNVVAAACRDLAPFFYGFHLTIAVHFPETCLFAVHSPGHEPTRVACDETIEGYFLHHTDEDLLAIEDLDLWTSPPPLNLTRWPQEGKARSSLLAACRIHNNLIGVVGLRVETLWSWNTRDVEMLRTAAAGFGLAYYHAVLSDNLMYSCREAAKQLAEAQQEARTWRYRAEQVQTAAEIVRAIGVRLRVTDLLDELQRILTERWPACRVTLQRYIENKSVFVAYPVAQLGTEMGRPARTCIQRLFLNNVLVTHVICDSPQEIATYADLDRQFVEECEREGFGSFCSAPIFLKDRLWGTITLQAREPGVCSLHVELLVEIARALALPIQMAETCAAPHPGAAGVAQLAERRDGGDTDFDR